MSMFVSSTSFWQQDQNWSASQANSLGGASTLAATATALFNAGSSSSSNSTSASKALDATLGPFGATVMNASTGMAVLAAQQASARVNAGTAKLASSQPTTSVADVASQVTFSGSLATPSTFGTTGPAQSGGFQFVTGTALQNAFNLAMIGQKSNGDAIDTVSVSGNTLTASTSGINAHPVFTLSLKPDSGLYTFTLDNPIDMTASRLDTSATLNLSLLMHAVKADGTAVTLPNSAIVEVHNGLGDATGTASRGVIHEGGLAYTGPTNTPAPTTPAAPVAYVPPTNPLTGYAYTASGAALTANANAVNILS